MKLPYGWAGVAGAYIFLFLALGVHVPFWPLWLEEWGLTSGEVGAFTAASIAIRVIFGLALPLAADRAGAPRRALSLLLLAASLAFLMHLMAPGRGSLLALTLVSAAALAGAMPIMDALSLRAARQGGFSYAPVRSVGSLAFLGANLLCGLAIGYFGANAALWWVVLALLPAAWLGLRHPGGAGIPLPRPQLAEVPRLLKSRAILLTMIAAASLQASHAVLYTYGSLHWRSQGIEDSTIGALWAFGVGLEVLLMAVAGKRLIDWLGPAGAMALSGAVGILRWALMTTDPGLPLLWALQASHSITFTAAFLGAIAMVDRAAPANLSATAQGLVAATAGGLLMAGATLAATWAYPAYGADAYWIGVALSLLGLCAALRLRYQPQSR